MTRTLRARYDAEGGPGEDDILRDVTEYLDGLVARELIRDH